MLVGKNITLRALEDSDIEKLRLWRNHPELIGLHCSDMPISSIEQKQWYERYASNPCNHIFIIENKEHIAVGYTIIKDIDHKNGQAEIGLHLDPQNQGQGYGKDAFQTLIKFCFHELHLHRVSLEVFDFNERAIGMYKKMGFQVEGCLREAYFTQNAYHDIILMSVLDREFHSE